MIPGDSLEVLPGLAFSALQMTLVGAVFLVVLSMVVYVVSRYKRCPANRVLVRYGAMKSGKAAECYHGGGVFVYPFIQDYAYLSLDPIRVNSTKVRVNDKSGDVVNVTFRMVVGIGTDQKTMENAAHRLLTLSEDLIANTADQIMRGNIRTVAMGRTVEEIERRTDEFVSDVLRSTTPEYKVIGLVIIDFEIEKVEIEKS